MDQKTQRSRAFRPHSATVSHAFLTAPLSYDAVALHQGQCEKLLRYVVVISFFQLSAGACDVDRLIVSCGSHSPFHEESPRWVLFAIFSIGYAVPAPLY